MNHSSSDVTLIADLPSHFAVSTNNLYHFTMTDTVYWSCSGNEIKICPTTFGIMTRANLDCISSIFFEDNAAIMKKCNIKYQTNGLLETALSLGSGQYFISAPTSATWSLTCKTTSPSVLKPCTMCIMTLPCNCELSNANFIIPRSIETCASNITKVTFLHTTNIAVLQAFHDSDLQKITASTLFTLPPKYNFPDFNVIQKNWSTIAQTDDAYLLDFKQILKSVQNQNKIYASKADMIDRVNSFSDPNLFSQHSSVIIPAIITAIITLSTQLSSTSSSDANWPSYSPSLLRHNKQVPYRSPHSSSHFQS